MILGHTVALDPRTGGALASRLWDRPHRQDSAAGGITIIGDAYMTLDKDAIEEIRSALDDASTTLYAYLNTSFGSYKKAPDDHPIFKALQSIKDAVDRLPEEDEEEGINDA